MSDIKIKRIYDKPSVEDGKRILVDRLWPRGLSKDKARVDHWEKDIAPSHELRKWFNHTPDKWVEFKKRYFRELDSINLDHFLSIISNSKTTLMFSAKETKYNNAAALKEYLENINKAHK
ncbi:MAG TPA: DUF488 family protein [Thermodesulfobacteriota bacterium]|nr:DUF488 family protein [Thermodesulfobacteriota bacterium]